MTSLKAKRERFFEILSRRLTELRLLRRDGRQNSRRSLHLVWKRLWIRVFLCELQKLIDLLLDV